MHVAPNTMERLRRPYSAPFLVSLEGLRHYDDVPTWQRAAKRLMDVSISLTALAVLLPMVPVAWWIMKRKAPGPLFFRQQRVGWNRRRLLDRRRNDDEVVGNNRRTANGRRANDGSEGERGAYGAPFTILKLRTMVPDADKNGAEWAKEDDERITNVGRILRKYRLDELPQFWNVLKGEMSIVGPRPEQIPIIDSIVQGGDSSYVGRLRFKPGITGLAQITVGYDSDYKGISLKVNQDVEYIRRFSIWLDMKILAKTFAVVLKGKGSK